MADCVQSHHSTVTYYRLLTQLVTAIFLESCQENFAVKLRNGAAARPNHSPSYMYSIIVIVIIVVIHVLLIFFLFRVAVSTV